MDIHNLKEHLDSRLDKLEYKLDDHLERISKAETSIEWIRGHLKFSLTIALSAVTGMAGALYHYLKG